MLGLHERGDEGGEARGGDTHVQEGRRKAAVEWLGVLTAGELSLSESMLSLFQV